MKNLVAIAVMLAVALACGLGAKEEVTDISEVRREYQQSAESAREKFEGKELIILGNVTYRSTVNPGIRVGSSSNSDIPITVPDIECIYEESDVLFKDVTENQLIKIKGVLKITDSGIEMKPCKFVPF